MATNHGVGGSNPSSPMIIICRRYHDMLKRETSSSTHRDRAPSEMGTTLSNGSTQEDGKQRVVSLLLVDLSIRQITKLKNVSRRIDEVERSGDGRTDLQSRYENRQYLFSSYWRARIDDFSKRSSLLPSRKEREGKNLFFSPRERALEKMRFLTCRKTKGRSLLHPPTSRGGGN